MVNVNYNDEESIKEMCRGLKSDWYVTDTVSYVKKKELNGLLYLAHSALVQQEKAIKVQCKLLIAETDPDRKEELKIYVKELLKSYEKYKALYKSASSME